MKKFDYFCIVYSVALLIFGFNDDTPKPAHAAESIRPPTNIGQQVARNTSVQSQGYSQYASIVRISRKPTVPAQTVVSRK